MYSRILIMNGYNKLLIKFTFPKLGVSFRNRATDLGSAGYDAYLSSTVIADFSVILFSDEVETGGSDGGINAFTNWWSNAYFIQ